MYSHKKPWGCYEVLAEGEGYKVKKITVEPGHRFSYQYHNERQETWIILDGEGTVVADGHKFETKPKGKVFFIPRKTKHRAGCSEKSSVPLTFIEVQVGQYLEEDDIVRLEDDYNRTEESGETNG